MADKKTAAEEQLTITISGMPDSLLKRIERLAERDRRNRSSMINRLLEESVAKKESELQPA